jgi:hypothetical protein
MVSFPWRPHANDCETLKWIGAEIPTPQRESAREKRAERQEIFASSCAVTDMLVVDP